MLKFQLTIHEQDKSFHAQLSLTCKSVINSEPGMCYVHDVNLDCKQQLEIAIDANCHPRFHCSPVCLNNITNQKITNVYLQVANKHNHMYE